METLTFHGANLGYEDNTNKSDQKLFCEVQAIVLAHYSTYDIHPLLQRDNTGKEKPKFLLPFGNKPIITYPLRLLEIHGFTDIIVVVTDLFAEDMINFLATYKHYDDGSDLHNIKPVTVNEEDLGEIQVLKQIHKHIKTDFLVIRCDIFTNAPLRQLLTVHRRENSSITLLLSKQINHQKNLKKAKRKCKNSQVHIIGTDRKYHQKLVLNGHPKEIERLWYMKARADLEDDDDENHKNKHDAPQLTLDKKLLDHIPSLRFTTKFKLQQIGIFCRWILLWILEDAPKDYELLYEEAVPHLIDMQTEINTVTSTQEIDDIESVHTNESNKVGSSFDFPDLICRSSQPTDMGEKERKSAKLPYKTQKQSSHYASGLFLSHGDVLGNDYLNVSNSSLPRVLMMKTFDDGNIKTFDDAKSDITQISMSAVSTIVNAPVTPKENTNEMDQEIVATQTVPLAKKSNPLNQHIDTLPSPERLAFVDDDLPKITQQFLAKQQSQYMGHDNADKLKVFGYVHNEDNNNGLFSCIINSSDCFLSLSMSLINSVIKFEQKQEQKQRFGEGQNNRRRKIKKFKQNHIDNEEREEYIAMREFEENGLLHLILGCNAINDCREQNGSSMIKNGCIISANCMIGEKTRIDKCVLSPFVNIGKNCKIINCVIFKHVTIGDQCKISNTIISTNTSIGDKCVIHNCKIANNAKIAKQSALKNQTLQIGTINDQNDDILNID